MNLHKNKEKQKELKEIKKQIPIRNTFFIFKIRKTNSRGFPNPQFHLIKSINLLKSVRKKKGLNTMTSNFFEFNFDAWSFLNCQPIIHFLQLFGIVIVRVKYFLQCGNI